MKPHIRFADGKWSVVEVRTTSFGQANPDLVRLNRLAWFWCHMRNGKMKCAVL